MSSSDKHEPQESKTIELVENDKPEGQETDKDTEDNHKTVPPTSSPQSNVHLELPSRSDSPIEKITTEESQELLVKKYSDDNEAHPKESDVDNANFLIDLFHNISYETIFGIVTGFFAFLLGFTAWGGSFVDIYTMLYGAPKPSGDVVIVNITPEALHMWQGPQMEADITPRGLLAELISFLDAAGAQTITLDVILDSPQDGDDKLHQSIKAHGAVIAASQIVQNQPHFSDDLFVAGTIPEIAYDENNNPVMLTGYANVYQEDPIFFGDTMVTRGVFPFQRVNYLSSSMSWPEVEATHPNAVILPISLLTAISFQERQQNNLEFSMDNIVHAIDQEQSSCSQLLQNDYIIDDACQYKPLWLMPWGSDTKSQFVQVNAASILRSMANHALTARLYAENGLGAPPPFKVSEKFQDTFKDKAVIIGRVDQYENNFDRHVTTYSFPLFDQYDMAGVHLQAQFVESFLQRKYIHFLPRWVEWLLALSTIGFFVKAYFKYPLKYHIPLFLGSFSILLSLGYLIFVSVNFVVLELSIPITLSMMTLIFLNVRYPKEKHDPD